MDTLVLSEEQELLAENIYKESIVYDGCVPWGALDYLESAQQCIDGGMTVINLTVAHWPENFDRGVKKIIHYKKIIDNNSDKFMLIKDIADIKKAKEQKKLGIVLAFQDGVPIEDNIDYLNVYYDMGVRVIQLTYNAQNYIGTGCCELSYGKVTYFGRKVIKRMNELGIAIDLSHCSDPTTIDAIKLSEKPVYITHSSVRNICNAYGRNKTDDQIKILAEKGGVIGICLSPTFLRRNNETFEILPSTIEDALDHIDYVVNLVGIDHVAFGSDLVESHIENKTLPASSSIIHWRPLRPDVFGKGTIDRYDPRPEGLESHLKFINLARGLVMRGYREVDIKKVLGGNVVRILEEIWKR